ncbi:uncharacterized protein F4822DRAFT_392492 [Hypoxylon trugodes]|uniref:uncharacterized protein n=1 Tax=Hypoxylon trugodes TaxID=326681 RepID=UPI0021943F0B|nr:uncharacterized protein F4822DRAFT_392492 [Hypoxylon trugodes]KAI1392881.1 hypothetical protein F4822DRAFT_392492 [Hypoxylon trugodes]
MVLKRKRSESELSFSSSSAFSSPPRPELFTPMDMDSSPIRRTSRSSTPAHLHSRTFKRFRDSRPSDEEIHQRTLNMLYTAQKQQIAHQQHFNLASLAIQPQPQPATTHTQGGQASLHNFWKLPSTAAPASAPVQTPITYEGPVNCEDCGQGLCEGASDEDSMDVDSFGTAAQTSCGGCGKHVCSHCSITNLGEQRRCLICAGKKVWVGGVGWAGVSSVKVC